MFAILKAKYQEQGGVPIVRIMSQLSSIDRVSYSELEQGVRNPEGIWDWLLRNRNDPRSSRGCLTNREIYNYSDDCSFAQNRKLADVIRRHCLTVEFMGYLEETVSGTSMWNFPIS